jgi:hypothetical protein
LSFSDECGPRNCTGPNVSTLVGVDFCDRDDVQMMLNDSNSDMVKCVYNPGLQKRIRLSLSCQSSLPSSKLTDVFENVIKFPPNVDVSPQPTGGCFESGCIWIIEPGTSFRIPSIQYPGHENKQMIKVGSILFCRELWPHNECRDNPLRGATRIAKIFIDGIEVRSINICSCNDTATWFRV